jgi:hypothetical protein
MSHLTFSISHHTIPPTDRTEKVNAMSNEWHELTDLTGDRLFVVTSVRLEKSGVAIEGEFELPPLARLRYEDQVFVSEFLRSHGSIKDMEKAFGVSYPTVKNRLNRIADQLSLVQVVVQERTPTSRDDVLSMLERGEISVDSAAEGLRR